MGVEQVDRRVLLEPDEAHEDRQQEQRAGDQLRADDAERQRRAAAELVARERIAGERGERGGQQRGDGADDQRVDQVALEVDASATSG